MIVTYQIFDNREDILFGSVRIPFVPSDSDSGLVLVVAVGELHIDVIVSSDLADNCSLAPDDFGVMSWINVNLNLEVFKCLKMEQKKTK